MYSSLLKVDIVADTAAGPLFVQTDHRSATEMNEEPEITILFALTRVLNARRCAPESKPATVLYACMQQPTPQLVEALAAAGAELDLEGGKERKKLAPVAVMPAELADKAFAALARRVQARTGLTDMAGTLHALEAETLANPLDADEDEIGYWTRVMELAAVTGELLRARLGGCWTQIEDRSDVPFGFARTPTGGNLDSMITLATNRAARFIADGEGESMFHLLEAEDEADAREHGPILPSLRKRADALREKMVFRPLLERTDDPDLPVIAYGTDGERTFGIITSERGEDPVALHEAALVNIAKQEVNVDRIDIADVDVVVVSDSFFATEKLLDCAFMQKLHRDLGAEMLAVATPCRGIMFVTNAASADPMRSMTLLRLMIEKESQTTRSIAPAIMLVRDGEVVGQVKLTSDDSPVEPPPKKPGFFRRLFGGGQA